MGGHLRPDVYSLRHIEGKERREPTAYEVKVSYQDFKNDLKSNKSDRYYEIADKVFYASDKGLIGVEEVPDPFGLLVRDDMGCW